MVRYPDIDPVAIAIGPVKIHWYGLMYLIAFYGAWWLGIRRTRLAHVRFTPQQVGDLIFYGALGVILGGRIGYVLFYNLPRFVDDPLMILRIWEGGMSFHGGLLGVIVAMWWFARRTGFSFYEVADFTAVLVPFGLFCGRIGNFINGELWGAPTDLPWGMVFPHVDSQPRHPSMLYEALLEGVVLFAVLWWFARRPRPAPAVSALFILLYGVFRILVEFVREPDAHIGYLAFGWVTMGQLLSLPMVLAGAFFLWWAYHRAPGARGGPRRS